MEPIITVYSGTPGERKKFEGFIAAAFWIGVGHAEGEVNSVKIRQPSQSYDNDVANLAQFTALLVQRQINFSVEFFTEPSQETAPAMAAESSETNESKGSPEPASDFSDNLDFEAELTKMKEQFQKGAVSKKQFESNRTALLRKWKEKVEGRMGT